MDLNVINCFVCNEYLGPFRNKLTTKMEASGKCAFKLLETLLDTKITKSMRTSCYVCQDCFMKLEKYEDLQKEAEAIQENLFNLFNQSSENIEPIVHIKIETPTDHGMKIQCSKCSEQFSTLSELNNHKDCLEADFEEFFEESDEEYLPKSKRKSKKVIKSLNENISENFKVLARQSGVDYDIESFHKAFGAPTERLFAEEVPKKKEVKSQPKVVRSNWISPEFSKTLQQHGINYSLETFQRAFGFIDSIEIPKKSKNDTFKCEKCKMEFPRVQEFKSHMKTHMSGEFNCEECQTSYQTKASLDLHLSSNHGRQKDGPFVCPVCLKSFRKKELLRSHLMIHGDERKYLCTQCGASFIHRRSFQMHLMVHDDIRPFECKVCSKRFRSNTKLIVHSRIHTGERLYQCPHCPGEKTFRQKWGMDLHIKKTHLNETTGSEICQVCGANFQLKSKLRQHLVNAHQVANADHYGNYDEDQ